MSEWISVKDRLPEYAEDVLVYDSSYDEMAVRSLSAVIDLADDYTDEIPFDEDCWTDGEDNAWPLEEYSHWMPLPDPPEEGDAQ